MTDIRVDPSISRSPVADAGRDLATVCVLCSQNCGLRVDVEGGRISAVRPDERNHLTHGYACNKAVTIGRYAHHEQRITTPLRRRPDGTFEPVSWDTALDAIASGLDRLRKTHGPRSIALVGVGGQANHMDAGFALGFLQGIGSKRWFNAYAQEKTQNHLVEGWMMRASPGVILHADTAHCRYLLVLGTNPRVSNRGHAANDTFRAIGGDPERRLVVVDPRETETTRGADRHLRVRPGGDCYLLLSLCATIVREGLCDRRFIEERTRDAEIVERLLRGLDPDALARRAGLDPEAVRDEAVAFAKADGAAVLWDLGIEHGRFSTLNAYLLRLLVALTGNLGRKGGMRFVEGVNPPGSGVTRGRPERALASGIPAIRALGNYAMFSPSLFPEEVLVDHPERIRGVIVEGANPLLSFSDTPRWREAFSKLELKVVIEPAMTETARLADWVLPTPVGYEKWEICGFPTGSEEVKAQLRPPVIPAPEGPLPEPEIYARLAERMSLFGRAPRVLSVMAKRADTPAGAALYASTLLAMARVGGAVGKNGTQNRALFWGYRTLGPTMAAPSLVMPWLVCHANAVSRRRAVVRALGEGFARATPFTLAQELFRRMMQHPEGFTVAVLEPDGHLERNVGYDDKRVRLAPAEMMAEVARCIAAGDDTSGEFPWVLAAGLRTRWTANTIQRDPAWRKGKGPHCALTLHPDDAKAIGVREGEAVRLTTAGGAAVLACSLDERAGRGFVAIPNGFGVGYAKGEGAPGALDGLNANELTRGADRDPFTGCPQHKHVPCRVERVETAAG